MTARSLKGIVQLGLIALIAIPGATQARGSKVNRSVDTIHQPVVSHAAYTFDVRPGMDGDLSVPEARRLNDWFASIGLGYGDRVSLTGDPAAVGPALREGIANVVARHGLLIDEDSSAIAGTASEGGVRLIVRRAMASVPGCPNWSSKAETDANLGASSNYGCAMNSNFAAMIANPEDLVRGQGSDSDLRTATSNRAISTYREKAPTGSGELKSQYGAQ
ncbi:CpaD family pilus assembly lipoprotein [Sphingobium cloacae]|uniref:Flp pilus assembly protein CpaD n=1 Tax=Sphingobium cloacae TaxID=120107 RepID=A0A1E1F5Z8_9SPHN|nr:CpaD family pilus assembly lipoprotein [Sphingobium cloacae]BAV65946.1 Flp pilus assembly protein CpaD [Sphingobium cloacae]